MPWMEASLSIRTMSLRRDVSRVIATETQNGLGVGNSSSDDALDLLLSGSLSSVESRYSTDKLEST
jgi:hypothetical protein